jgi:serine/threonine-protein kinase
MDDTDLRPAIGHGTRPDEARDWPGAAGGPRYGDAGYGLPDGGLPRHALAGGETMRFGPPGEEAANHTLVVSPGTILPGFDDPDDDRGGHRRRSPRRERYRGDGEPLLQRLLFSRRLIYLLGALAAILGGVLLAWYLSSGQYTTVPQVTGWTQALARTELKGLGLTVREGPGRHSDTVAAGHIVATDPRAGSRIPSGGTIRLFLSLGPVTVQVPPVSGQPVQQAIAQLRQAGLQVTQPVTTTPSATIPAGTVISTNPPGGTQWPKNKPVTVTVSGGAPLPNFSGAPLAAAQAAAQQGGYQINPVTDTKSTQPSGTITGQSPAAGTAITPGEVVTVNVSAGPAEVAVPDVLGQKVDDARQTLQQAGFQVQVSGGFGNRVTGFSPTGQAPAGSTITLIVGLF